MFPRIKKKSSIQLFYWIAVICLSLGTSGLVYAKIADSAHDFSDEAWSGGELCVPCHTPHNSMSMTNAPLWNHDVTSASFNLYDSATFDGPATQPGGVSKLCLSCHDGTVALNSYGGNSGSTMITGEADLGFDISNDHPISVPWLHEPMGGNDGGGNPSYCSNCHDPIDIDPIEMTVPFFDDDEDDLTPTTMECASCHDPHNSVPEDSWAMLRIVNSGSALCLRCHDK